MMKNIILLISLFAVVNITNAQNQNDFDTFLNYFKKTELPIDTRNYMKRKRGENQILPNNLNLKFICKNDTNKMHYFLELISDDTQELTFSGYVTYVIGAADYYSLNEFLFTIYQRKRQDEGKMYYLASFTKGGMMCDSLLVLSTNDDAMWFEWICSKISKDRVVVFHYSGDYIKKMNTIITVNTYQIDNRTGNFILVREENFESKCSIDDFYGKNEKCLNEDPYYRY